MDLNTYHSKSQSLAKRRPYKAVFLLPITPDSDYREEVDMLFPTFAEYPILCKKPYRKSNNTVRYPRSDNLLLVPFCLRGVVPDESVFSSEGILGIDALTKSRRQVGFVKNLPPPEMRSYFPQKSLWHLQNIKNERALHKIQKVGNDMATVLISAFCSALHSNNSSAAKVMRICE